MTIEERNHTIDILRGLTIILVVFGHIIRIGWLNRYIWSFHLPIFFVISGYLYNPDKFTTFCAFLKRKFKGLIVPYLVFGVLTYMYWLLAECRFRGSDLNAWEQFFGIFYGTRYDHYLDFNGPLWFIPCLFTMEILFYIIEKLKRPLVILVICVALFVFGVYSKDYYPWLPFGICAASIGIIFYVGGYFLRKLGQKIELGKTWISTHKLLVVLFVIVLVVLQVLAVPYSHADLSRRETGNPFIYIGMAYLGFLIYWQVSVLAKKSKLLEWLGMNSLVIFALHGPVYRALVYITSFVTKMEVMAIRKDILCSLTITIITIAIIVPFILLWNKWGKPLTK